MIALADLVTQLQTLRRRAEGTVLTTVLQPDELQAVKDAADRLARLEALMPNLDGVIDCSGRCHCVNCTNDRKALWRDLLQLRGTL